MCILWTPFRRHELRVRNISTMFGRHKWGWRVLWGQSNVPAGTATTSASEALSLLRPAPTQQLRQLGDIRRDPPRLAVRLRTSRRCDGICGDAACLPTRGEKVMANASKLICGAALAAVSIASPALAAHKSKPISTRQNVYVPRSSQGSGACVPTPSCPGLPSCDPCSGISYPRGEPGGSGG